MTAPVEIGCDESGYEGERLIGATTEVFAHASVSLAAATVAECIQEIRGRIRSPAQEYKAGHLLREKHRRVLRWLLGPDAPLRGNAHVFLVDKAYFVVRALVTTLLDDDGEATGIVYREGPRSFGSESWQAFLASANTVLRTKDRLGVLAPVDAFFATVSGLRGDGPIADVLAALTRARARAYAFRARLLDDPPAEPVLDPLFPAIRHAVEYWADGGQRVSIVHDLQSTLSPDRVTQLVDWAGGRLTGVTLVDSSVDPRVQMADMLAGTARKIALDALNDRGDAQLIASLRGYVDAHSIWGDQRSWSWLRPESRVTR